MALFPKSKVLKGLVRAVVPLMYFYVSFVLDNFPPYPISEHFRKLKLVIGELKLVGRGMKVPGGKTRKTST